jgi:(p)ppGpp synthase/HD superfamily hydrolase
LLHDAAEDFGGRDQLEDIRAKFGDSVAKIVEAMPDGWTTPKARGRSER